MTARVKVAAVLIQLEDDRIVCTKRKHRWLLPSVKLEPGEFPKRGAGRALKQYFGLTAKASNLLERREFTHLPEREDGRIVVMTVYDLCMDRGTITHRFSSNDFRVRVGLILPARLNAGQFHTLHAKMLEELGIWPKHPVALAARIQKRPAHLSMRGPVLFAEPKAGLEPAT